MEVKAPAHDVCGTGGQLPSAAVAVAVAVAGGPQPARSKSDIAKDVRTLRQDGTEGVIRTGRSDCDEMMIDHSLLLSTFTLH